VKTVVNSSLLLAPKQQIRVAIGWAPTVLLALSICAGCLWLWGTRLRSYVLKLDDFVYVARSRSTTSLRSHLFTPHNGHIVPLFMLETHLLTRLAGSLEALPTVLSWASYATLVLSMALTGHLVAWETGRPALGLVAMAAVGFSSVMGPALLWYAAGQALASGTMILAMLAALQAWRVRGSWWLLAAAAMAAMAAPLLWTAGYAGGLVGAAYLWADRRRVCRRAAALPLCVSIATLVGSRGVVSRLFALPANGHPEPLRVAMEVGPALAHSAQAVCEALVINNLGLDTATTATQAFVIGLVLAAIWAWSRHRREHNGSRLLPRINPLESAGAVLVATSFGMIFAVRGTEASFDGLRALGWYDAIPQLGAVLFVSGWWAGHIKSPPPESIGPPHRSELIVFVVVAAAMLVLQTPRVNRVIFQYDGLSAPYGRHHPPLTTSDFVERARIQRQAFAALDRIEHAVRTRRIGPAEIRQEVNRVMDSEMAKGLDGMRADDLLDIPDSLTPSVESESSRPGVPSRSVDRVAHMPNTINFLKV
jgi:hypothetical protein